MSARISSIIGDQGYVADRGGIFVFLDGKAVRDCLVADEERGCIVQLKRGIGGKLVADGQRLATVERRGVVRIQRSGNRMRRT